MRTRILLLWILLMGSGCPLIPHDGDPFQHYPYPASIAVRLEPADAGRSSASSADVVGMLRSENGTLRNLMVYLEASDDWTVVSSHAPTYDEVTPILLGVLHEGEEQRFPFRVLKKGAPADVSGSWARIRVTYVPDYDRLLVLVSDSLRYPPPEVRLHYIALTQQNRMIKASATDAARLFFP